LAEGKVVIVSGATGALGRVVTKQALEMGMKVAIPYRSEARLGELINFLGGRNDNLLTSQALATSEEQMKAFVDGVVATWKRVDALLNIAGGYKGGKVVQETPLDDWEAMLDTNFRTALVCCRAVLPIMLEQDYGRIVNVAARPAVERRSRAKSGAYAVSKAAVAVLSETIAEECKKTGVTANAIVPSTIDTPSNRKEMPQGDFSRWPSAEDVAKVIFFLASDDCKITGGALVPVYGKA
jgi:NAD(P)-dependent dehydrogenase (short-subunit alcohol dehydrogenase family)